MPDRIISVAICTYNRADSLEKTLDIFTRQTRVEDIAWELLLIDNHSTDDTRAVADSFRTRSPLRYFMEPNQGLSNARNRALREFAGDVLLFTDDDVELDPGWLSAYASALRDFPDADFFGGRILPSWPRGAPAWLVDPSLSLISGLLGYYDLGESVRELAAAEPTPFGANFAIRRRLGERLGPFRTDLGVKGGNPGRGEEAEYFDRAIRAGSAGVYVGNAVCYHRQDPERFKPAYLYRYGIEKGRTEVLTGNPARGKRAVQLNFALRGVWQLARGRGDRFRQCVINMGIQQGLMQEHRKRRA